MIKLIMAIWGLIQPHLGLKTDAANSSGSLNAKVRHLIDAAVPAGIVSVNNNVNTRQKPRGPAPFVQAYLTDGSNYTTIINYSGKGRLRYLATVGTYAVSVLLVVDGVTLVSGTASGTGYPDNNFFLNAWSSQSFSSSGRPENAEINFKSSLLLQAKSPGGNIYAVYETE